MTEQYIKKYLKGYKRYKESWNYEDGCILKGAQEIFHATQDKEYFDFIYSYCNESISEDGSIRGYNARRCHLDDICSGRVLFELYEITKEERFKKAVEEIYNQITIQPRNTMGSFWHKDIYPNQVWLDGLYMVLPFYTAYENVFLENGNYDDIIKQIVNMKEVMKDKSTGLYYHGYDDSRKEAWANPKTGLSQCFWGRAIGWLCIGLVDVLEIMPKDRIHEINIIKEVYINLIDSMIKYQDKESGMWFQVVDSGAKEGNYLETSATLMLAYSILKGCRLGFLDESIREHGKLAYEGTMKKYLTESEDTFELAGMCSVAGLGNVPYRDGSYEYYLTEPVVSNDSKGLGAMMMAYSEMLRISR